MEKRMQNNISSAAGFILSGMIIILFCSIFSPAISAEPVREWTFMFFFAADNDLEQSGVRDIMILEKIGSSAQINLVAQIDRSSSVFNHDPDSFSGARRYFVKYSNRPDRIASSVIKDLGITNTGDPKYLADFIAQTIKEYPANRYALIVWAHGTGVISVPYSNTGSFSTAGPSSGGFQMDAINRAIAYDDGQQDFLTVPELRGAIAEGLTRSGRQKLDLLVFDACLMNMIEVVYELKDLTEYIVGSPETVPAGGFNWHSSLNRLQHEPLLSNSELSSRLVDDYIQLYNDKKINVCASAIKTSNIDDVANSIREISKHLKSNPLIGMVLTDVPQKILSFSRGRFVDSVQFFREINSRITDPVFSELTQNLETAMKRLVISSKSVGRKYQNFTGLSLYFERPVKSEYRQLSFGKNTGWLDFLTYYQKQKKSLRIGRIKIADSGRDGRIGPAENFVIRFPITYEGSKKLPGIDFVLNSDNSNLEIIDSIVRGDLIPGKAIMIDFKGKSKPGLNLKDTFELKLQIKSGSSKITITAVKLTCTENFQANNPHLIYNLSSSATANLHQSVLNSNGLNADVFNYQTEGGISELLLDNYLAGWVIVAGDDLKVADYDKQTLMLPVLSHLEKGGRVIIAGQDTLGTLYFTRHIPRYTGSELFEDDVMGASAIILDSTRESLIIEDELFMDSFRDAPASRVLAWYLDNRDIKRPAAIASQTHNLVLLGFGLGAFKSQPESAAKLLQNIFETFNQNPANQLLTQKLIKSLSSKIKQNQTVPEHLIENIRQQLVEGWDAGNPEFYQELMTAFSEADSKFKPEIAETLLNIFQVIIPRGDGGLKPGVLNRDIQTLQNSL